MILRRFRKLYPELGDNFIQRVICDDSGSDKVIADFKQPESDVPYSLSLEKEPHIVVSVDMMDTGIDVPHVGNLVFFKVVRSKTKFWQMIGRGTRKCPGMECVDFIDGSYTDKRRFFIFDFCGNFNFFRENPNGIDSERIESLREVIYKKRIHIAKHLQQGDYAGEAYQAWRESLIDTCCGQAAELQPLIAEHIAVKLERQYVDKYGARDQYDILDETKVRELCEHIAPLVLLHDEDVDACRFDSFIYGMILMALEKGRVSGGYKKGLRSYGHALEGIGATPVVAPHLPLIHEMQQDEFTQSCDILRFEELRVKLRDLMHLLPHGEEKIVETSLTDPVIHREEGVELDDSYDFEDYKLKVNRYVNEHKNSIVIYKLMHNEPLTQSDYKELERILTVELGNAEDYQNAYGETPFGLMIRRIAKLDHDAAVQAFSAFINDTNLTAEQISFVQKIIAHVEQNGYMEDPTVLLRAPFDKPKPFIKLFDHEGRTKLLDAIKKVKENAEVVA